MRLSQTRLYQRGEGSYSILHAAELDTPMWVMERRWRDNEPNVSCVPLGFYSLVPHSGEKYKDTWALVGETVSHWAEPGADRSFCVFHWEDDAEFLKGCLSVAWSLGPDGRLYDPQRKALAELKRLLSVNLESHYLTISGAPGYMESTQVGEEGE